MSGPVNKNPVSSPITLKAAYNTPKMMSAPSVDTTMSRKTANVDSHHLPQMTNVVKDSTMTVSA
jgi:hypothetical protein